MKILITGASGQLGSRLVRQLATENYKLRGTILKDDPCKNRLDGLDIELMEGDLVCSDFVNRAVAGVDAVIHTANMVSLKHGLTNININWQVAQVCGQHADKLDRVIYVSSSGVFPNDSQILKCEYHPVDEKHPKRPIDNYSLSKLIGEEIFQSVSRQKGLRIVIVRPSGIISGTRILERFTVKYVYNMLKKHYRSQASELYMPNGKEYMEKLEAAMADPDRPCSVSDLKGDPWYYQPNDARDVAHLLVCALKSDQAIGESFNAGAPEPFPYPEGAKILAKLTGKEVFEISLPVRWRFDHAIEKACRLINYRPQGNLQKVMRSAASVQNQEGQDYIW